MSFLVVSALAVKASIRHCLPEDLKASLDRDLEAPFLMVWVPL